ncbi:MAG TPA: hypothetical protein VEY30_06320, partial [Myxococcaceae bacterium]|nr:hypothetical protein [Myxococcaceae bacterium]
MACTVGLMLCAARPVLADEAPVEVMVEVVLASNQDAVVEPASLSAMKAQFAEAGFNFTSYRRLSSRKVSIAQSHEATVDLPNQKRASLRLKALKEGTASIQVEIPGAVNTLVKLGRKGSVFQHTGAHQ